MPDAFEPGPPPSTSRFALLAWNMLQGLDWPGIPIVAEVLGIRDIESLVVQLIAIRDWQRRKEQN